MNVLAATIPNPGGGPRARLKTGTQAPRKTRRRRATPASSPISPITNGRPRPARLIGVELLAGDVLHRPIGVLGPRVADHHRHRRQAQRARGGEAVKASDQLE